MCESMHGPMFWLNVSESNWLSVGEVDAEVDAEDRL